MSAVPCFLPRTFPACPFFLLKRTGGAGRGEKNHRFLSFFFSLLHPPPQVYRFVLYVSGGPGFLFHPSFLTSHGFLFSHSLHRPFPDPNEGGGCPVLLSLILPCFSCPLFPFSEPGSPLPNGDSAGSGWVSLFCLGRVCRAFRWSRWCFRTVLFFPHSPFLSSALVCLSRDVVKVAPASSRDPPRFLGATAVFLSLELSSPPWPKTSRISWLLAVRFRGFPRVFMYRLHSLFF